PYVAARGQVTEASCSSSDSLLEVRHNYLLNKSSLELTNHGLNRHYWEEKCQTPKHTT
ncbi:hypothetical protein HAX54_008443, partial [Datura stramonium]|nr:hypothetical protein [Datura stramonium]